MRLISAGLSRARKPTTQNVAFTPYCLSRSSRRGVWSGSGPSSKVSATAWVPVVPAEPFGPVPARGGGGAVGLPGGLAGGAVLTPDRLAGRLAPDGGSDDRVDGVSGAVPASAPATGVTGRRPGWDRRSDWARQAVSTRMPASAAGRARRRRAMRRTPGGSVASSVRAHVNRSRREFQSPVRSSAGPGAAHVAGLTPPDRTPRTE